MLEGFINDKWFEMLDSFSYEHFLTYPEKWKQGYIDSWRANKGLSKIEFPKALIIWNMKQI